MGMHQFISCKQYTTTPSDPPWWNPECLYAVVFKEQAWRRWRRFPFSEPLKQTFLQSVNHASTVMDKAHLAWERRVQAKLCAGNLCDKQWWSVKKSVAGVKRSSDIPTLIDAHGQECATNLAKANCFGSFLSKKCSLASDISVDSLPAASGDSETPAVTRIHFRADTVRRQLARRDSSKATGPDNIPARVLKECATELAGPRARLFSLSFSAGHQPQAWKVARVVPVYKKSSKSAETNYRPVSLLSICSKVMESIINRQLMNFLEGQNLLSPRQFGFRRGLGPSDLLTGQHHKWSATSGLGGSVEVLAVDIAGAFDKVFHTGVLHKLRNIGVKGHLLDWLRDYLTGRSLEVVIGGKSSDRYPISAGVPQGSILGAFLFLVYVNDADSCLAPGSEMGTFADDITLYACFNTRDDAIQADSLQASVNALHAWRTKWHVKFEPSKSQLLRISCHRQQPWPVPAINFGGEVIPQQPPLKLLGVIVDSKLSFSAHLRSVAARANSCIGLICRAARVLDCHGMLAVYHGFVRPLLEYAPLVWMGAAPTSLEHLNRVQRLALHILGPNILLQSLEARRTVAH